MPIDWDALRGDVSDSPEDGAHVALLERAALVDTANGERLVTEWRSPDAAWNSWNRFDTSGMSYTRDMLLGLGVNLGVVNDENALTDALERCVNRYWRVTTTSNPGSRGDRIFVSTYVTGTAAATDQQPAPASVDVPIDTRGLPEPAAPGAQFGARAPF